MDPTLIIIIFLLAIIAELIDASLGMLYGTTLSPILIIMGFDPFVTVPAILFSQGLGGLTAAIRHHKFGNANFHFKTDDFKSFLAISVPGLIAVLIGIIIAINIPKEILKAYIAFLVILVGIVIVFKLSFKFSWKKMWFIGFLSSFNKTVSGGGFGPFVTGGQVAIGQKSKNAISITTLSEVPICLGSFLAYFATKGFSDWSFLIILTSGALLGGVIGPTITKNVDENKLKAAIGILVLALGIALATNLMGWWDITGFKI
ncbi:MAG: sulfite exporter TauE/SafE family protein [Candidatus Micrarchaeota archaeon]